MKTLKNFTDVQLNKELTRRDKKRKGPVKGYRVTFPGDDYNYGSYSDYMIGDTRYNNGKHILTKKTAFEFASTAAKEDCGSISEIYKNTPKPGKIY